MSDLPDQQVTSGLSAKLASCLGNVADGGIECWSRMQVMRTSRLHRPCETASSRELISDQLTELAMTIDLG